MADNHTQLFKLLSDPPVPYRSAPFWAWNDTLDPEELNRQIQEMAGQGIGGFFIHSREGLETEYLGERWMECVGSAVDEARRQGMEAWIYDEDKWPSGSAGGLVSASDAPAFTAKGLTAQLLEDCSRDSLERVFSESGLLGVYALQFRPGPASSELSGFRRILSPEEFENSEETPPVCLVCRMETSGPSEWYNNLAPTDSLNPEGIRKFLALTHEEYESRFGSDFGKTIRGFFTDEPNFCDFFSHFTPGRPWLPWSAGLAEVFARDRSCDPAEILPLLFFHGPGEEKARYDYWLTLTEQFSAAYMKQISLWCEQRGLELTGHVLYENDLGYSVRVSGAAMPHYRHMHAPGIDLLGDQRQEYLTVKQCTSVANQFDRKMVITETYGCTGWDFSFAGQKRLGDWQFVMGVNRRCQHLALYSFTGCRKRDYPPSFNYHNGWWEYNRGLEEYFARLSVCVTEGQVHRDILVIHPMSSFWMKSGSAMDEDLGRVEMNMGWLDDHILSLNKEGDRYNKLAEMLLRSHFDFDFGDELIMRDEGNCEEGVLSIGSGRYKTVVVPGVDNLMSSTLDLLESFLESGGSLLWVGAPASYVDGSPSKRSDSLSLYPGFRVAGDYRELLSLLESSVNRAVSLYDDPGNELKGFLSMSRSQGKTEILTLVNTEDREQQVVIHFGKRGRLFSYDPLRDIRREEAAVLREGDPGMTLSTVFTAEESRVFFILTDEAPMETRREPFYRHPHRIEKLALSFPLSAEYDLTAENVLTLDTCRFRRDQGPWSDICSVWQGQKALRQDLGMPQVYYNGAPQRYSWLSPEEERTLYPLTLEFEFTVEYIPEGPVYAAIEKSREFRVFCNDLPCELTEETFLDRALNKFSLPRLKKGVNRLTVSLDYCDATELEDIYILGSFGVSPERSITELPGKLRAGDWTFQGLFHYPGNVRYRYTLPALSSSWRGKPLQLKLGAFGGTLAVIRINSGPPLYGLKENSCLEIGDSLFFDRENRVEVEVVGSLRNMMGPFHRSFTSCSRISWEDFRTEGVSFFPEYQVVPMGILGEVALISAVE